MLKWLSGKKTYVVCISAIVAAIAGLATGQLTLVEVIAAVLAALGGMTLRAGIAKVE